jgi:glycosyltransferase involved in cell wall biosynthesis
VPISETPQLSVIIASFNSARTIEACLKSLESQVTNERFEVILVDSSTDGTSALVEKKFTQVKLHRFNQRKFPGDARNWGISVARGKILAFLDADCTVERNWVNEVLKAHLSPHLVIGGVVENGSPKSLVGWGYYFCEFSLWMPKSSKREIREVAACCLSLKRFAFDRYGPFIEGTYCSDTAFQWNLQRDGQKVLFVPTIKVSHITTYNLVGFLKHIIHHRMNFVEVMIREQKMTQGYQTAFFAALPLFPFLLFGCIANRLLKAKTYLPQFILASPIVFLGLVARSWGEFLGFLQKRGT